MRYGVYSQSSWLFPDTQADMRDSEVSMALLLGQSGGFQLLVQDLCPGTTVSCRTEGLTGVRTEIFREIAVTVNRNTNNLQNGVHTSDDWDEIGRYRVRRAPYDVFDALEPAEGATVKNGTEAFYITCMPAMDAAPGLSEGRIILSFGGQEAAAAVKIQVGHTCLEEPSLHLTNWFSVANMARDHGLEPDSPRHWDMMGKYAETMRGCHQDIFWITWEDLKAETADGRIRFDFGAVKKRVDFFLRYGFRRIEWSPVIYRPSWDEPPFLIKDLTRNGKPLECLTTGLKYLTAFLKQFYAFVTENGWQDISLVHICDEPRELCAHDYRILAGVFRKYLPGIKLMDAVEIFCVQEALDIYVAKNHYFQLCRNEFEALRDENNEMWFYTCNMPGGKFLNRFLDNPLHHTRLLHWGNFRYGLSGYLHWGYNQIRAGQDPFRETSGDEILPAGDTHIVYPAENGPLRSMRYEQMKAGVEDYTLLKMLERKEPQKAKEMCRACLFAFDEYETDPIAFDRRQRELTLAVEAAYREEA